MNVICFFSRCCINETTFNGRMFINYAVVATVMTFLVCCICYLSIFIKIKKITNKISATSSVNNVGKYSKTAALLSLFVLTYIIQWLGFIVYTIRFLLFEPGIYSRLFFIAFSNLGGVFNFAAYTYVRNKVTHKDN